MLGMSLSHRSYIIGEIESHVRNMLMSHDRDEADPYARVEAESHVTCQR